MNDVEVEKAYGEAYMDTYMERYRVSYNPPVKFPLYNFLASYVGTGTYWSSATMNSVLSGNSQPVSYRVFPHYLVKSSLPIANSSSSPIYYAPGEEFGKLMMVWNGASGTAVGEYLQGVYVPVNENFTSR